MHLCYLLHARYPSEKAQALYAAQHCSSFALLGLTVTIVAPRRLDRERVTHQQFYALADKVQVAYVATLDVFSMPIFKKIAFTISNTIYSITALVWLLRSVPRSSFVCSNEVMPLLLASLFFKNCIFEVHDYPETYKSVYAYLFKKCAYVLSTNTWKKEKLHSDFGIPYEKIITETNGVNVEDFSNTLSKVEARKCLEIDQGVKVVVYTGYLYGWKGAGVLAEASKHLPGVAIYFVGGTDLDIVQFRKEYALCKNIYIVGRRPHGTMHVWHKAADVLIIPNTAKERISKYYTSPMKMFEYALSRTPIVAADLPSIRAFLNEDNCYFAQPDNPRSFADVIERALLDKDASIKTENAYTAALQHSWSARASRILIIWQKTI
jgi:glycosyltransferase involved in cell wall biosynthesis